MSLQQNNQGPLSVNKPFGHGWIPNNTGRIYFNLIAVGIEEHTEEEKKDCTSFFKDEKNITIKELDTSYISDSRYIPKSNGFMGWLGKFLNEYIRKGRVFTHPETQLKIPVTQELESNADIKFTYDGNSLETKGKITFKLIDIMEENKIIQFSTAEFRIKHNGKIEFSEVVISNNTTKYLTNFLDDKDTDLQNLAL